MEPIEFMHKMIESNLGNLSKKFLLVKHHHMEKSMLDNITESILKESNIKVFFHEYKIHKMKEAYEPFLEWIRESYYESYADLFSVDEFVKECGIYSLQQEVFCSYIEKGECKRKLEVMIEEFEYENEKMIESVYSALKYISKNQKTLFVINEFHMAPYSTLNLVNRIVNEEDNMYFLLTCGENYLVKEYCRELWNNFISVMERGNMILEMENLYVNSNMNFPDEFFYKDAEVEQYVIMLNNMVHTHSFIDVKYYFDNLMEHILNDDSDIPDNIRFRLLVLLAMTDIGMRNYKAALYVCENMVHIYTRTGRLYSEYLYNYFSAKAHLLMTESELAFKFCERCKELANELSDERLLMNVYAIESIGRFGSLSELFRCDFSYKIEDKVIDLLKKYNYENLLAYMYIFGFDNDRECVEKIGNGIMQSKYFNKGIKIGKKLENENLLLLAYMKNIIMYSSYGFHNYVMTMYKKRLKLMDMKNPIKAAHMYGGLGYSSIVVEDYAKADAYFRKSIKIEIKYNEAEDIAEMLYNMSLNYFIIEAYEKVVECINLMFKIMESIHIQGIRICNTSKLYGLIALSYYKMGHYYDCFYFIKKMENYLSYILNKEDDKMDYRWIEDLVLYYLCKANRNMYDNDYEKADENFELGYKMMNLADGIKFYSYSEYAIARADFYDKVNDKERKEKILQEALDYCYENNYCVQAKKLEAMLHNEKYDVKYKFVEQPLPVEEISAVCMNVGTRVELEDREKDINFLTLCHDVMIREQNSVLEVVENTMNIVQNSYSFDRLMLLEKNKNRTTVTYSNKRVNLKSKEIEEIYEFFDEYHREFMTNRLEKSFPIYSVVSDKFGTNDIATIVGVPTFEEGVLSRIFIGIVDVHRNFTGNRRLLSKNSLAAIKFAISQLGEAIKEIKNSSMIKAMNLELERSAITDQLTGIYNRMGLDKILKGDIGNTGTVIYMDIDNFKKYNDTYGHSTGDTVLKGFANILKENVAGIGYAVRYGGDEFLAIIPKRDQLYCENIAKNIQNQLRDDYNLRTAVDGNEITSSMGIATYEEATWNGFEEALRQADKALYKVKKTGKGKVELQINMV